MVIKMLTIPWRKMDQYTTSTKYKKTPNGVMELKNIVTEKNH